MRCITMDVSATCWSQGVSTVLDTSPILLFFLTHVPRFIFSTLNDVSISFANSTLKPAGLNPPH